MTNITFQPACVCFCVCLSFLTLHICCFVHSFSILEHPAISQPTYVNMSELASMVALKNTNINNSNNIIATTSSSSTAAQPNSPALSSTSSLVSVSPDSSATNPISSPEAQTPQNTPQTNSPLLTAVVAGNNNIDENISASTTPTNQIAPVDTSTSSVPLDNNFSPKTLANDLTAAAADLTKCDSPPIDTKSTGSVLDKASMFEKKLEEQQAQAALQPATTHHHHPISLLNSTLNLTPATVARLESIYGKKTEEIYNKTSSTTTLDRVDTGQLFSSSSHFSLSLSLCKYFVSATK